MSEYVISTTEVPGERREFPFGLESSHPLPGTCNAWSRAFVGSPAGLAADSPTSVLRDSAGSSFALLFLGAGLVIDGRAVVATREMGAREWHVVLPNSNLQVSKRSRPGVAELLADVQRWTRWSDRKAAIIIGTTHPTIKRLAQNESSPRSSQAIERLRHVHDVLERLAPLVTDPEELRELLQASPGDSRVSVEDLLINANYGAAYRLALTEVSGPRPVMLGSSPARPGHATFPVDSDDGM